MQMLQSIKTKRSIKKLRERFPLHISCSFSHSWNNHSIIQMHKVCSISEYKEKKSN